MHMYLCLKHKIQVTYLSLCGWKSNYIKLTFFIKLQLTSQIINHYYRLSVVNSCTVRRLFMYLLNNCFFVCAKNRKAYTDRTTL